MLQKLFQRIAVEFSFLSKKHKPEYAFNPLIKSIDKKYEDIDVYVEFLDATREKINIYTALNIQFTDGFAFGMKPISLKRKLFHPLAEYQSEGLLKTEILLFEISYRGFSTMTEFHFYEKKLFYIECDLIDISHSERTELLDEIKGFYNVKFEGIKNPKITDARGYIISIENLDKFKIIFADTGNAFFKELENIEVFYNKKETSGKVLLDSTSLNNNEEERIEKIKGAL